MGLIDYHIIMILISLSTHGTPKKQPKQKGIFEISKTLNPEMRFDFPTEFRNHLTPVCFSQNFHVRELYQTEKA